MGVTRLMEDARGVGERIDRYDLVAELASGGMATVYLARLSGVGGFQRSFAIKRLHAHLAVDGDFVQMFFDEARLAALIRHPNVVPILEVGEGADGYYLVMEYVEGDTFASLLSKTAAKGNRIPLDICLRITVDMLRGLDAAHELRDDHGVHVGLVHRDVSPQNVLVGTDGITRITDFGVARAASKLSETRAGELKGKLAYMAPEQATGAEDIDRRVDVFSSGIVLWEALAFKRLFKSKSEAQTLSRVMNEPVRSPAEFNPAVPSAVAAVCLKALERDRERRWASCAEFADALERAAMQANQLASVRDVADYVHKVVGEDVQSQRGAVREWVERRERSAVSMTPPPPSSQSLLATPELSSITLASARAPTPTGPSRPRASRPPPPPSLRGSLAPASTLQQPVPVAAPAESSKSKRGVLLLVGLVVLLGVAGAWFLSSKKEPVADQQPVAATAVSPTTAPMQPATAAAPEQPAERDKDAKPEKTALSSDDLPSDSAETDSTPTTRAHAPRRPARPAAAPTPKPAAPKKPKLDLDNPYQ